MNTESTFSADEQLLHWLMSVARRADVLARGSCTDPAMARRIWLRAEFEIFERAECLTPSMVLRAAA